MMTKGVRLSLVCIGLLLPFWLFSGAARSEPTTREGSDTDAPLISDLRNAKEVATSDFRLACLFYYMASHSKLLNENPDIVEKNTVNGHTVIPYGDDPEDPPNTVKRTKNIGSIYFEGNLYYYMVIPLKFLPMWMREKNSLFDLLDIPIFHIKERGITIQCPNTNLTFLFEISPLGSERLSKLVFWKPQ